MARNTIDFLVIPFVSYVPLVPSRHKKGHKGPKGRSWAWGQALANLIEHTVDETRRIGRAKAARQLNGFIEGDSRGCLGGKQQLESAQAQHIAVHTGHARQSPVLRRLCQSIVNL